MSFRYSLTMSLSKIGLKNIYVFKNIYFELLLLNYLFYFIWVPQFLHIDIREGHCDTRELFELTAKGGVVRGRHNSLRKACLLVNTSHPVFHFDI